MEFDRSKILTVVTADQAIGFKKGWFSNDTPSLKIYIERGDEPKELQSVDIHNDYPFKESYPSDGSFACKYRYFYPAPEPSYAERQAQWVKENGVVSGTRVRFIKNFVKDEGGSICCKHDTANGRNGTVSFIIKQHIEVDVDGEPLSWSVPFTAIEVIKEPTYRPFKNADEFKPYREKWLKMRGVIFHHDGYYDEGIIIEGERIYWIDAFNDYKFEDGTPFGIKEQS